MKQTRKHVNNINNISEQDKDRLDRNDKMKIGLNSRLEENDKQYSEKGNTPKEEYFVESCRTVHDEESLINTDSVQKHDGQKSIKVNFHPVPFDSLSTIEPELENGLKGLSMSGSTSIGENEGRVKSDETGDEIKTVENETNQKEGINSDNKKQTTDVVDRSENIKTIEEESSQVRIIILFLYQLKTSNVSRK